MYQPTVVFDFDGVIHSYKSGWKGAAEIPDPPVDGIQQVIEDLQERGYRVVIVSSRCTEPEGIVAIRDWLKVNGFPCLEVMAENLLLWFMSMTEQFALTGTAKPFMRKLTISSRGIRRESDYENH